MTTFRSISIVEESSNSAQTRKFGFCSDIFPYFEIIILCDNLEPKNSKAFSICHLKAGTWERQGQFAVLCLLGLPQDWQGDLCQMDSRYLLSRASPGPLLKVQILFLKGALIKSGETYFGGASSSQVRWDLCCQPSSVKGKVKGPPPTSICGDPILWQMFTTFGSKYH